MLSIFCEGELVLLQEGVPREHRQTAKASLKQYDQNAWYIKSGNARFRNQSKQKRWYLFGDETIESEYEQQSSADRDDDEAKLVQVFVCSSR